jgi:hypothetical protein
MPLPGRLTLIPFALLLLGAAPAPTIIPHPEYANHRLIIPHDSPVKFRRWQEHGVAIFDGQFVLAGSWSYGCAFDCGDPPDEAYYQFELRPDPAFAGRMPHWNSSSDMSVIITREDRLVRSVVAPDLRAALRADKVPYVMGRVSIVVDEFRTGFSCDSPYFSARFVAIAKAQKLARPDFSGVSSCG